MTAFERSTIRLAWLTFLVAIVAAFFVGLQWHEMHTGSTDTHNLAEAASGEFGAMRELARAASGQAGSMQLLADRMKDQADRTKAIADTDRNNLELSQRPWISNKLGVTGPLEFDGGGGGLPLTMEVTNVGHSPAQYFQPRAKLVETMGISQPEAPGVIDTVCRSFNLKQPTIR